MELDKSEQFYQQAFGFEVARRMDFPEYKFTLSYLLVPGDAFELELILNYDQKEPYELGTGYSHLALGVKDLEASHKRPDGMGFHPEPLKGLPGGEAKFYFLADPDGYLVEVVKVRKFHEKFFILSRMKTCFSILFFRDKEKLKNILRKTWSSATLFPLFVGSDDFLIIGQEQI